MVVVVVVVVVVVAAFGADDNHWLWTCQLGKVFGRDWSTTFLRIDVRRALRLGGAGKTDTVHVSNEKNPGCLVYIGGYTTQLYRDYNKPL